MSGPRELQKQAEAVQQRLIDGLLDGERLQLVKAPPGAGKTFLLLQLVAAGVRQGLRLAVATFTNAQANDICRRLGHEHPDVKTYRFVSATGADPDVASTTRVIRKTQELPHGPSVVVATTAKWAFSDIAPFDVLLIDEAWQIGWADFQLLTPIAGRFVFIGDPGQIPPVVSIPTERWETSPNAPHHPLPERVLGDPSLGAVVSELPGSRRLPHDAVELVNEFYDFSFGAFAEPGERFLRLTKGSRNPVDSALDLLQSVSIVGVTVPTPDTGPPTEIDDEIASHVGEVVRRLLARTPHVSDDRETASAPVPLDAKDIGVVSTHRAMNTRLHYHLPRGAQGVVNVDTPERWQGLECKVMIAVHPLSGVSDPTAFELETGRLCVMASRHRAGLILLTRDHISDTLRSHIVAAEQPVGRRDIAGEGLHRHTEFWDLLRKRDQVISL